MPINASEVKWDETPKIDPSKVTWDNDSESNTIPRTLGQRIKNLPLAAASDVGNAVKGLYNTVAHPQQTVEGLTLLGEGAKQAVFGNRPAAQQYDENGNPLPGLSDEDRTKADAVFAPTKKTIMESVEHPAGIPGRVGNYALDHPVNAAMYVSGVAGGIRKAAEIGDLATVAKLAKDIETYINPVSAVSKGAATLANKISDTNLPEKIMGRTMKIPPGSLKQGGRESVLQTVTREQGLPLGANTVDQYTDIVGKLDKDITRQIDSAAKGGAQVNMDRVTTALEKLKDNYKNRRDSQAYFDAIDKVKADLIDHDFNERISKTSMKPVSSNILGPDGKPIVTLQPVTEQVRTGFMDVDKAHQLKKGLYQEVQDWYMKAQKPETGRVGLHNDVEAVAQAEAAGVLRDEILNNPQVPYSVKKSLRTEAGLLNARKWVERATNRGGNLDPISISGMMFGVMVDHGLPGAAAWRLVMSQPVMSRIAIGLAKGGKTGWGSLKSNILFQAGNANSGDQK